MADLSPCSQIPDKANVKEEVWFILPQAFRGFSLWLLDMAAGAYDKHSYPTHDRKEAERDVEERARDRL